MVHQLFGLSYGYADDAADIAPFGFSVCAFCAGAFSAFLASSRLLADHGCVSTGSKTSESALGSCAEARNAKR